MQEGSEEKHMEEKHERLAAMLPFLRPGLICEIGCGSGSVLEFLSERLPGSTLVGVDRSLERLKAAASGSGSRAHLVASEAGERVFGHDRFDSVVFVWSMHEIYSGAGDRGVLDTLSAVRDMLKKEGVVVLQDFLKPAPRNVTLGFKDDPIRDSFLRFAREFRQRSIDYDDIGGRVRLDVADAIEFISKLGIDDDEEWHREMDETHFFYTLDQQTAIARQAGLTVERAEGFPLNWEALDMAKRGMDFDFAGAFSWLQLVLKKHT